MDAAGVDNAQNIIFWGSLLIAAFGLLGAFVVWIRRRVFKATESKSQSDWTLGELRDLKNRGRITETEYQALRARVLAEAGVDPETIKRATSADEA